jgi:CHAT domain-containing protein
MTEKIRVLFLAANPVDGKYHARLDEEAREIDEKIQQGTKRDSFEVISRWAVRPSDLQKLLLRHQPHIVHFSGHGSKTEGIILEDNEGNMKPVSKEALIGLFRTLKDNIRIVFLNACHSKRQIDGLRATIDFTIVMKTTIGDSTAVVFSSYFYQSLAFGRSVKEAFELAKNQLALEGIEETKTPELLVREGVDASNTYLYEG